MESRESKPGLIHLKIVEVMKQFPDGISGGQIRQELEKQGLQPEDQTHLDRRKRDLKKWFNIRKIPSSVVINGKERKAVLYQYLGERQRVSDEGQINLRLRAEVIHGAHGRFRLRSGGKQQFQVGAVNAISPAFRLLLRRFLQLPTDLFKLSDTLRGVLRQILVAQEDVIGAPPA